MKKILLFLSLILLGAFATMAQEVLALAFKMEQKTKMRPKIFIEPVVYSGNKSPINIDSLLKKRLDNTTWVNYPRGKALRLQNHWRNQQVYTVLAKKTGADVVISPSFNYNGEEKHVETWLREIDGRSGVHIPYKEVRATNIVDSELILSMKYSDNTTAVDTIKFDIRSVKKGRKRLKPLRILNESMLKDINSHLYRICKIVDSEIHRYRFLKVKVKDKQLKTELKTVNALLKEAKLSEVAAIYRKILDKEPSPEAHLCLGICYELAGDFKKAQEQFKHKVDFHIKLRMKNNMQVYNYMQKLGISLKAVEI